MIGSQKFSSQKKTFWSAGALVVAALMIFGSQSSRVFGGQPDSIATLEAQSEAFAWVAEHASPAVVHIQVEKTSQQTDRSRGRSPRSLSPNDERLRRFFGEPGQTPQPRRQRGQGSGFLISEDGYLLTNNHVVGGADRMKITLQDGREFEGTLVGADPPSDVALVKIEGDDLPFMPLGDSDDVNVGQWVLAIGSPFGLNHSVTAGIVSAKERDEVGITEYANFIQTDAAINPGNSGGPLVNLQGEAIGMNTALYSQSGGYMGIGFAIPINMAKWVKTQIIESEGGEVTRGYFGAWIGDIDPALAGAFGLDEDTHGVIINEVIEDSPAETAGIQQGDIVLEMDGRVMTDATQLRLTIATMTPGSDVDLLVLRADREKHISFEVGTRPSDKKIARMDVSDEVTKLGLTLQSLKPEIAEQLGYAGESGVLISGVEPGSRAEDAGLRRGHLIKEVNRRPVSSLREFQEAFENTPDGRPLLLLVDNGRATRYVALRKN